MHIRRLLSATTALAITTLGLVALGAPAEAAQSVTVTPNTGLAGGQLVHATGSGFIDSGFELCLGVPTTNPDFEGFVCAIAGSVRPRLDVNGSFSTDFRVQRYLYIIDPTINRWVDCADASVPCVLIATDDTLQVTLTPLNFAAPPAPPATRGQVTVTPSTGLHNLDQVTLGGSGFRANAIVEFIMCDSSVTQRSDCTFAVLATAQANSSGTLPATPAPIPSSFEGLDGTYACWTAPGCRIAAYEVVDFNGTVVSKAITLAANTGVPALRLDPSSGVVAGRGQVQGIGQNYTPGRGGGLCQSVATALPFTLNSCGWIAETDDGPRMYSADIGGDGSLVGFMNIERYFYVPVENRWVDCSAAGESCVVVAFEVGDEGTVLKSAAAVLGLAAPPAPPATRGQVTATPTTRPSAGQLIQVTTSGFRDNVEISVCKTGATSKADCDIGWRFGPANTGTSYVSYTFPLDAGHIMTMFGGTTFDCRSSANACVLAVAEAVDFPGTVVTVPLDVSLPPVPKIQIDPATDVFSRQAIQVTGANFPHNVAVTLQTCALSPGAGACSMAETTTSDGAGNISATYHPIRVFSDIDCLHASQCSVRASWVTTQATAPIAFYPAQPDGQVWRIGNGPLLYDNVYSVTGTNQLRSHAIEPGGKWSYAVRIQNDSPVTDDITVTGPAAAPQYFTLRYFVGYYDVTAQVTNGGFTFHDVAPGETRKLAVQFKAAPDTPLKASYTAPVTSTSALDPDGMDVIRLKVSVPNIV